MVDDDDEYFGSPGRVALARRSARLWTLLRDDPRFAYYGRLVALSDPRDDAAEILEALARLQGAAVSYFTPAEAADRLFADLARRGLSTDRHEQFHGGEEAVAASRRLLSQHVLPSDLDVRVVTPDTPHEIVADVARLCESCGVMPVPGSVMRGRSRTGVCLVALDRDRRAVATASSYAMHHPDGPRANDVFWGMLATRDDRRGERIALLLGAQAIVHMAERHGARGFMTGVRADNRSSQNLCMRLAVGPTDRIYASCIDPGQFADGAITR